MALEPVQAQSSDVVYLTDGQIQSSAGWNPYPGLGYDAVAGESCVSPHLGIPTHPTSPSGYSSGYTSPIPTTPLAMNEYRPVRHGSLWLPLTPGGDIYSSRFPHNNRTSFFQKGNFDALWMPKTGDEKTSLTQLDVALSFGVPLFDPDSPLLITPTFEAWFFRSNKQEWKSTLYTTGVELRWIKPLVKDKFTIDLGVSALYSSDFHNKSKKVIRFPAHVTAIWAFNPRTKIVGGVMYQDRKHKYNWLPVAGVIWTPNEDLNFELVFPKMRIARRVRWFGAGAGDDRSDWIYGAMEFAGGAWSDYEQLAGGEERHTFEYRDWRLLLGAERRTSFGMTLGFEVGYAFERYIDADGASAHQPDSVFLRFRTTF